MIRFRHPEEQRSCDVRIFCSWTSTEAGRWEKKKLHPGRPGIRIFIIFVVTIRRNTAGCSLCQVTNLENLVTGKAQHARCSGGSRPSARDMFSFRALGVGCCACIVQGFPEPVTCMSTTSRVFLSSGEKETDCRIF